VYRFAFEMNAAALICAHNHPSGNPEPSREDIRVTRQLVEAGKIFGVPVHAHLISAGKRLFGKSLRKQKRESGLV
jgi:DNA repair protein RadC